MSSASPTPFGDHQPAPTAFAESDGAPHDTHGLSHTSIILISAFLLIFVVFTVVSVHGTRFTSLSRDTTTRRSRSRRGTARRPTLHEIWLDDDDRTHARLSGAPVDWQPVAAWTRKSNQQQQQPPPPPPTPARHGRSSRRRPTPEPPVNDHHVMMAQAWFRGAAPLDLDAPPEFVAPAAPERRTLSVAVLIAMPSPPPSSPPDAGPAHGSTAPGPRPLRGDAELLLGVARLPCEERAIAAALVARRRTP
ncbi:hypothetical protein BC834DRAFT_843086 [Gloeopeniophorella convolvens]|nr:hypothetical protein BC834DRAFT_843086 [Gloeopeniophorella convolvens]